MKEENKPCTTWHVIGKTIRGHSHIRSGQPNQDNILFERGESETGLPVIAAVSDGHGSAKCFRSQLGSQLAVHIARMELRKLYKIHKDSSLSAIKRFAEEKLAETIVRSWKAVVHSDFAAQPFSEEELKKLEEKEGTSSVKRVEEDPYLAYGATLLAVLVTDRYVLYIQLGDGDILSLREEEAKRAVPQDPKLIANHTTSLCSKGAWNDFRIVFQSVTHLPPSLILLSTDGYANSFRDEEGFMKVGPDLLHLIQTEGLDMVEENLASWLDEASRIGSGDDVTLALIYRSETSGEGNMHE